MKNNPFTKYFYDDWHSRPMSANLNYYIQQKNLVVNRKSIVLQKVKNYYKNR